MGKHSYQVVNITFENYNQRANGELLPKKKKHSELTRQHRKKKFTKLHISQKNKKKNFLSFATRSSTSKT